MSATSPGGSGMSIAAPKMRTFVDSFGVAAPAAAVATATSAARRMRSTSRFTVVILDPATREEHVVVGAAAIGLAGEEVLAYRLEPVRAEERRGVGQRRPTLIGVEIGDAGEDEAKFPEMGYRALHHQQFRALRVHYQRIVGTTIFREDIIERFGDELDTAGEFDLGPDLAMFGEVHHR